MSDCLFCRIVAGLEPAHVVLNEPAGMAFLDLRPVFRGHTLIVPREHHGTLPELPVEHVEPLFGLVRRVAAAIPGALGAQGTFVAMNNVVSQSVPHLHVHVVPRTKGDGLRGFFWPRLRYTDDAEAAAVADRIRTEVGRLSPSG